MPIYIYDCNGGHTFEITQSIKDPPRQRCPQCRRKCHRVISHTSFILKGTGWERDGYSSVGEKKSPSKPKKD